MAFDYQHMLGATMDYGLMPVDVLDFVERVRTRRNKNPQLLEADVPHRRDDWDVLRWMELTSDPGKLSALFRYGDHAIINELRLNYYKIMCALFFVEDSPHRTNLVMQGPLLLLAKELGYVGTYNDAYGCRGKRPAWQLPWCDEHGRAPYVPLAGMNYEALSRRWGKGGSKLRQAHGLIAMGEHSHPDPKGSNKTLRRPCFLRINSKNKIEQTGFYEYAHIRQNRLMQTIGSNYIEDLNEGP